MQQEISTVVASPSVDDWTTALICAFGKTAAGMGFDQCEMAIDQDAPLFDMGASLSLVSETDTIQIELLGERAPFECLGRTLMMMEADEELDWPDVVDAVSEIVNVVAGALKSEMIDSVPSLRLGLPVFAETIHHRAADVRRVRLVLNAAHTTLSVRVHSAR